MKVFVVDQSFFGLLYDVQFSAALAAAGAEVTLIGRRLRAYEEMTSGGFRYLPLFYGLAERLPGRLRPLARATKGFEHASGMAALVDLVRRERPDAVHFQWIVLPFVDGIYIPRLARLAPLVLTVHNSVPFHGKSSSALMLRGQDSALRGFAHYIPHTENIRDYLIGQGVPAERVAFLPHPAVRLPRDPSVAAAPRPADAPVEILFFGSIREYKGVDVLVRAALLLARRRRDFHVRIVGRRFFPLDDLQREIEAASAEAFVTLEGRHLTEIELGATIERSDVVVFPYREIDASGAFACASQFGKPIIATELGVFADPPVRDHLTLIPPESPEALADALEHLIADPSARAAAAERSRALQGLMYTWERFADDCLDLYRRLGAGTRRAA